jgi:AcrR family transcriptional regulator
MESRREREKEGRRSLIIDTAEKVFAEKGYDLTTMDEIAKLADFTKKSVYSYFPTKDELFAAAVVRAVKVLERLFSDAVSAHSTGFEKVCGIGDAYVRFYKDYPSAFRILSIRRYGNPDKSGPGRDEIAARGEAIFTIMVESFVCGQKDGSVRSDISPVMAALHVMSVSNGILELVTETHGEMKKRFGMGGQDFIRDSMDLIGESIKSKTTKGAKK